MSHVPISQFPVVSGALAQRRNLQRAEVTQQTFVLPTLLQRTQMRFWNSTPRIWIGWKSLGRDEASSATAVPDGGYWTGVKKDTFGAGACVSVGRDMVLVGNISSERGCKERGCDIDDCEPQAQTGSYRMGDLP